MVRNIRSLLMTGVCVVAWFLPSGRAEDSVAAARFGREGTGKVRVARSALTPQLLASGVRVVADYDGFVVVEGPANAIPTGSGVEVLSQENLVLLNAGTIDTTLPAAQQLQQPRGAFAGRTLHLVQFAG